MPLYYHKLIYNNLNFKYIKFYINKKRNDGGYIQFSDFILIDNLENEILWSTLNVNNVTSDSNNYGSTEGPSNLVDNNRNTKWCQAGFNSSSYIIIELNNSIDLKNIIGYRWYTANDATDRDPISWIIYMSVDGNDWVEISKVENFTTTTDRNALAGTWIFNKLKEYASEGFEDFGHPIEYDSASDAKCGAVGIPPEEGLVFYASLNGKTPNYAETGQTINQSGNSLSYTTYKNIPCVNISQFGTYLYSFDTGCPTGNNPWTLSIWVSPLDIYSDYNFSVALLLGSWGYGNKRGAAIGTNNNAVLWNVDSGFNIKEITNGNWYFICSVYDGNSLTGYCENTKISQPYNEMNIYDDTINIGNNASRNVGGGNMKFKGYLSSARIYNRALTDKEITALSKEFKI